MTSAFAALSEILARLQRTEAEGLPWQEEDWQRRSGEQLGWERLNALTTYASALPRGSERFPHLFRVCESLGWWLPWDFSTPFALDRGRIGLGGTIYANSPLLVGSIERLVGELHELNAAEWRLDRDWGDLKPGESLAPDGDPHGNAKAGWGIARWIAREGKRLGCPVILDG